MVDVLRWWYGVMIQERVAGDIWLSWGWCDDFVVYEILDLMMEIDAVVSIMAILLVKGTILGRVIVGWKRVCSRFGIQWFEVSSLDQSVQYGRQGLVEIGDVFGCGVAVILRIGAVGLDRGLIKDVDIGCGGVVI